MREFASFLQTHLGLGNLPPLENLAASTDRYVLYKVGPVLVADVSSVLLFLFLCLGHNVLVIIKRIIHML